MPELFPLNFVDLPAPIRGILPDDPYRPPYEHRVDCEDGKRYLVSWFTAPLWIDTKRANRLRFADADWSMARIVAIEYWFEADGSHEAITYESLQSPSPVDRPGDPTALPDPPDADS